jgi:hypothetical protein
MNKTHAKTLRRQGKKKNASVWDSAILGRDRSVAIRDAAQIVCALSRRLGVGF